MFSEGWYHLSHRRAFRIPNDDRDKLRNSEIPLESLINMLESIDEDSVDYAIGVVESICSDLGKYIRNNYSDNLGVSREVINRLKDLANNKI